MYPVGRAGTVAQGSSVEGVVWMYELWERARSWRKRRRHMWWICSCMQPTGCGGCVVSGGCMWWVCSCMQPGVVLYFVWKEASPVPVCSPVWWLCCMWLCMVDAAMCPSGGEHTARAPCDRCGGGRKCGWRFTPHVLLDTLMPRPVSSRHVLLLSHTCCPTHAVPHMQVDVVVCDGCGPLLLGGGMLRALALVCRRWLKPGGLVLPDLASVHVTGVGV